MTSKFLVDPEILPVLDMVPPMDFTPETLPNIRVGVITQLAALPAPEDQPISVETIMVPGPSGAPPVRLMAYRPLNAVRALPAMLHIHGGGYVLGTADGSDAENRDLAMHLDCAIYAVDYRLAPETIFPGAIEDCYAALHWIVNNAETQNIDRAKIGVKGESAGGGLAAALALLVRDRGEMSLSFQHLIFPMLDDRTCVQNDTHPYAGEFLWTPKHNLFGWTSLLGGAPGGADVSPYAAAARAEDLRGLPAAFISVGALDLFLEENLEYARRLSRAGVPVELHVYPGAFHAFQLATTARISIVAERDSLDALRRAVCR